MARSTTRPPNRDRNRRARYGTTTARLSAVALVLVLALTASQRAAAQDAAPSGDASVSGAIAPGGVLRVGVAGSAPFLLPPDDPSAEPRGLSIEVWRDVAARNHWAYVYRRAETTERLLAMVASGEVDVGVGPTSITAERARRVTFSQPYQDASLAILTLNERRYTDRIRPFLSRAFALGIGSLLLVLLLVGTLVWLAERRRNTQQFPSAAAPGIANGVWLAVVTMTTVGYGDRAPITPLGRAIMGLWMFAALVTSSSLTASLTTAFTLSQLDPAAVLTSSDLRGRRVGAVAGTTSTRFVVRHGGTDVAYPGLDAAVRGLSRRQVSAVVFDRPALRHYVHQHPDLPLQISEASYEPQGYGFSVRHGSPLRLPIDVALLSLRQDGSVAAVAARWLGE